METIEIVGDNYFGAWDKVRVACRGIVVKDGLLLLNYETKTDQWMIPGGGIENDEDEKGCCVREVEEETGFVVEPSDCVLQITEYYEDTKFINRYFLCNIIGTSELHLTQREQAVGMEPRWMPIETIRTIFSKHADYTESNEMRRGLYMREYLALNKILP